METIEQLAARASVFKYLSLGFSPPGPLPYSELFTRLGEACGFLPNHQEILPSSLFDCGLEIGDCGDDRSPSIRTPNSEEGEYWRLFGPGGTVSPYETEYDPLVNARKGHELADLLGFYTAFGFKLREGELPDHLAVELEFLSLLLLKLLYARREGMREAEEVTRTAIASFLQDHLGRWVEAFAERVEKATASSALRALAKLLRAFIGEECRLFSIAPLTIQSTAVSTELGAGKRPKDPVECPFAKEGCG